MRRSAHEYTARHRQRKLGGGPAPVQRVARAAWGHAAYALLAVSVVVLAAAIMAAGRNTPAQAAGQPAASSAASAAADGPQWIALRSQASADIIAAVRQSRLFTLNRADTGDHLKDVSHVGTPALVTELRLSASSQGVDGYVVPIVDGSGATVGVAVAWLNPTRTAISVGYIRSYDVPMPSWTGTLPTASQATSLVQVQHHTGLRSGAQAQLVYFPFDFQGRWAGSVHWAAGGEGPDTPIWLVPGADGKDHFVGTDGHAYLVSELPIAPLAQ